jgi:hypothetical protein
LSHAAIVCANVGDAAYKNSEDDIVQGA